MPLSANRPSVQLFKSRHSPALRRRTLLLIGWHQRHHFGDGTTLRARFAVAASIMLALWGWSLVPPIENWRNPNEDGFSYVPVFFATITCLPVGIYLLVGAIAGHGRYVSRARIAFFIAAGITLLVLTFLVFQHIANNNDGKVFGIQIGFQLDHQDGREM
jgi:hypothetical protein